MAALPFCLILLNIIGDCCRNLSRMAVVKKPLHSESHYLASYLHYLRLISVISGLCPREPALKCETISPLQKTEKTSTDTPLHMF